MYYGDLFHRSLLACSADYQSSDAPDFPLVHIRHIPEITDLLVQQGNIVALACAALALCSPKESKFQVSSPLNPKRSICEVID
jgi:hypothetical protein